MNPFLIAEMSLIQQILVFVSNGKNKIEFRKLMSRLINCQIDDLMHVYACIGRIKRHSVDSSE